MQTHVYKQVDTLELRLDVHAPEKVRNGAPAIVWFHGGALINGDRDGRRGRFANYLSAGYTVFSVDYRLAPETKLPAIISDVRDALDWVRTEGPKHTGIDPTRVGVAGNSAGGYLALMTGTFATPPSAIVAFYGYGDIVGAWYSEPSQHYLEAEALVSEVDVRDNYSGPPVARPDERPGGGPFYLYTLQQGTWPLEVGGVDPREDPEFFVPYCPEQNVTASYPPTILLHGVTDTDVPYVMSQRMAGALESQNIPHEFVSIQGRGHGFEAWVDDPQIPAAWERVQAFLANHV